MVFTGVWAVVKNFINEKTRSKIKILGTNFHSSMLEIIDADNLPTFLGGTCTCSDSTGDCMTSNTGPWNDYEFTKPKGVKLKKD